MNTNLNVNKKPTGPDDQKKNRINCVIFLSYPSVLIFVFLVPQKSHLTEMILLRNQKHIFGRDIRITHSNQKVC